MVYGAFVPGIFTARSSYAIDGGTPVLFDLVLTSTQRLYRRPFFFSGPISFGAHTLVITNLGDKFRLDYIQVLVDGDGSSLAESEAASTQTARQLVTLSPRGADSSAEETAASVA